VDLKPYLREAAMYVYMFFIALGAAVFVGILSGMLMTIIAVS
jgi:hypothetical protein